MSQQETGFQKLTRIGNAKKTRVIMGLDPTEAEWAKAGPSGLLVTYKEKIKMAAPHIAGVKPNLAFYEGIDGGREVMAELMQFASEEHGLATIMDAKRGDIMNTQEQYAKADKKNFNPDIATLHGWSGSDAYLPYINAGMSSFVMSAMSNPSAKIQNLKVEDGLTVAQHVALDAHENGKEELGLVIGATQLESMKAIREIENKMKKEPLKVLAPGFGKQGGSLEIVSVAGNSTFYPISSGLTQEKYLNGMTTEKAAETWKKAINEQLER